MRAAVAGISQTQKLGLREEAGRQWTEFQRNQARLRRLRRDEEPPSGSLQDYQSQEQELLLASLHRSDGTRHAKNAWGLQ